MDVFNGVSNGDPNAIGDLSVGGILNGLGSLSNITNDSADIQKLKSQLSSKTNEIL
jgi:hypothetical protein